ncbi:tRNA (adenosine(37)-N6)-dimethylallyltransferase MiaA [Elioraea sp.]|uniref:tRNA (adenosine(37)-N6)-dimethylallyltransferase MiaA n=1 Tax=Elioraea sp. TaxID=2185103 RepID=UPI003F6F2BED
MAGQAAADDELPRAVIVAGPTASGKSALALALAERVGGVVINADSMQVYRELRILTARPTSAEEARVPHLLYGVRSAAEPADAAWFRGAALAAMAEVQAGGRVPILCGGTGMWLDALVRGIADIPAVPERVRAAARALAAEIGTPALHGRLHGCDPETAARLSPGDTQRVIRAWEVLEATGEGLAAWWRRPAAAPAPWTVVHVRLDPPRDLVRGAIDARFRAMMAAGALEEVRALAAMGLDPALPAMRAHGVPPLLAAIRGEITLSAAISRGQAMVRQYAKRQATWLRHHALAPSERTFAIDAWLGPNAQFSEKRMADLFAFIDDFLLTRRTMAG